MSKGELNLTSTGCDVDQFVRDNADFLSGYMVVDDDLPDGAWWCTHEDLAQEIIDQCQIQQFDSNDLVHAWLRHPK